MREILFRGKRKDNCEWVCGDLWNRPYAQNTICIVSFTEDTGTTGGLEVIHETVGQYTGYKDKNGQRIFEGDILKGAMRNLIVAYKGAGFIAYWNDHDYGYGTEQMWCNLVEGGEVIGTIHDNPELMEG